MELTKINTEMAIGIPMVQNIERATPTIKQVVQSTKVQFDKDSNMFILTFIDKDNKEVIQQVPTEAMIEFAKSINKINGLIIDTKA